MVRTAYQRGFTFDGQEFRTRMDLARHLAAITGRPVGSLRNWLRRFDGDAEAVIVHSATTMRQSRRQNLA